MSDVDDKLTEIRERHERDAMRCISPSIAGPQAHDDREWLLSEIERLRAEVKEQARILGVSAALEVKLRNRIELLEWAMVNTPQAM